MSPNSRTKKYSAFFVLCLLSFVKLQKLNAIERDERNYYPDCEEEKVKPEQGTKTKVISHELCLFCLSEEERKVAIARQENLENVHTYVELENDPRASLPSSFTICATLFSSKSNPYEPMFFTILGKDRNAWFSAALSQLSEISGKRFRYSGNNFASVDTMPVLPNQWVKSCIALNTVSGLVQWVARGSLVENNTFAGITDVRH